MMKHSFILITSELETRKRLLRKHNYIKINKSHTSITQKIKTLKISLKPKIYPIRKKKKKKQNKKQKPMF